MNKEEARFTEMMEYQESVFLAVLPVIVEKYERLHGGAVIVGNVVSKAQEYAIEARQQRFGE